MSAPLEVNLTDEAQLPTLFGDFRIRGFRGERPGDEHAAIYVGDIRDEAILTRIHSSCVTGDALGSLRCDCREQLQKALAAIAQEGRGLVLYLQQEGRGIGLASKVKAYALQDTGADTVEANVTLGFPPDARSYTVAAAALKALGVKSVRLLTNNPVKKAALEAHGVKVVERVPLPVTTNPHNERYLETKRERMGHDFPA
ncbi:MAG TPA: GTP cyclohydrolase II [Candidatus Thermoplasmatota archaeon]|nr:GTP cyclohydrolase II [Candidatus Thermoplasmatota archaeon]